MLFFHIWTPFVLNPFLLRRWSLFHNLFGNFIVNLEIKFNPKFKLCSLSGRDLLHSFSICFWEQRRRHKSMAPAGACSFCLLTVLFLKAWPSWSLATGLTHSLLSLCPATLREELTSWCECSLSHNSIGLEPDLLFRQNWGTLGGGRLEGEDLVQCFPGATIIQKSWETPHIIVF